MAALCILLHASRAADSFAAAILFSGAPIPTTPFEVLDSVTETEIENREALSCFASEYRGCWEMTPV